MHCHCACKEIASSSLSTEKKFIRMMSYTKYLYLLSDIFITAMAEPYSFFRLNRFFQNESTLRTK